MKFFNRKSKTAVLLLSFVLLLVASILIGKRATLLSYKYIELDVSEIMDMSGNRNAEMVVAPPTDREHFVSADIYDKGEGEVSLTFQSPITFSGISFYFPGDLGMETSFGAKNISLYYKDDNGKQCLLNRKTGNNKPYYEFYTKNEVRTSTIELTFSEPFVHGKAGGTIRINNLRLYEKGATSPLDSVVTLVKKYDHGVVAYPVYYLLFFLLLFIPGYTFFTKIKNKYKLDFDEELTLVMGPVFGITVMFLSTLLFLSTRIDPSLYLYFLLSVPLIFIFIKERLFINLKKHLTVLTPMGLALLLIFLVIVQRDYRFNMQYVGKYLDELVPVATDNYTGYFVDNMFPWRIGRLYLHNYALTNPFAVKLLEQTTIYSRTPLLPMIVAPIMSVFGEGHFVYQRFLEVLATLFVGAFYILIKKRYPVKVASIAVLLVLLNIQTFLLAMNAEIYYKFFSVYPIFLALIMFFFGGKYKNVIIGFLTTLAFLIHPSTLVYSLTIILLYLVEYRFKKEFLINVFPVILALFLATTGWIILPRITDNNGTSQKSLNIYLDEALHSSNNIVTTKTVNLALLFVPNILLTGEKTASVFSASHSFYYGLLRYSFISNTTPVYFAFFLFYLFRYFKKDWEPVFLIIAPLTIYWLFYLNRPNSFSTYGGAYFLLYPFVIPMFLTYTTNYLVKESKRIRILVFSSYIVFMAFNFYYLSGIFSNKSTTVPLSTWAILLVYEVLCVMLIKKVIQEK